MEYGGNHRTANYSTFFIDNEGSNYKLTAQGYSGDAGGEDDYVRIHI